MLASRLPAQEPAAPQDGPALPEARQPAAAAPEKLEDQPASDVYVNDSFEAADAVAKAEDFAAKHRWYEAAELLQKTSREAGDRLVRTSAGMHVGARPRINEVIASWPPEGVDAYCAVAEPVLRAKLLAIQGSKNPHDYLPLFDEYFCTDLAIPVGETIVELAVEAGSLQLARQVLGRLVDFHPQRAELRARLLPRIAVLSAMTGESVGDVPAEARIAWKGIERPLREVLSEIRSDFEDLRRPAPTTHWPTFGGEPDRNRLISTDVGEPGLLWRFAFVSVPGTENSSDSMLRAQREAARRLSVMPIVGGDLIYAQFERRIVALHRKTGAVAWQFESGAMNFDSDSFLDDRPPGWNSPTLADGRLFAALPAEQQSYYDSASERESPELVALDARTGDVFWSAGAAEFDIKRSDFVLDSAPIVANGRVHIVARRRRSFGFEDCYLYSLRAADGVVQSRVHLGGASTATFGSRTVTFAIPALHDGTIYVCSGLGTIAAVSAYTGAVEWLRTYDRFRESETGVPGIAARDLVPWQFNPVLYADGNLAALPTDSQNVLVLSSSGAIEQTVPRELAGDMQTLLGVRDGRVCGAGESIVCFDAADPSDQWSADLPPDRSLFGRASLTTDAVWVSTRAALLRFGIESGRHSEFAWPAKAEGGNVLATPDLIIVAEPTAIAAYGERERIWSDLRERIAAAPDDPLPALEFAEVAFGAGQFRDAVEALDLADKRLSASPSTALEDVRRRLFNDALTFGQSAAASGEPKAVEVFFNVGARQAWDKESNVRYRLHFASVFETIGEPARSAALYQQILRDRGLREFESASGAKKAGKTAEAGIGELIQRYGKPLYADIEAQAKEAFEAASKAESNDALLEVVATFPNSQAATRALALLGDRYASAGAVDAATRAFVRAFHGELPTADRANVLARLAELNVKAGRTHDAYLWLCKGAAQFPTVSIKQDGKKRTFLEWRDRLAMDAPLGVTSRPKLDLPLRASSRQSLDPDARLLTPLFADSPVNRWGIYFIETGKAIAAYSPRSADALWPRPAIPPAAAELLVELDHLAIFATKYQVFALDTTAGSTAWTLGREPAHVHDPGADWEEGGAIRDHALDAHLLITARDNGLFTAIDIRNGKVLWSKALAPPAGPLRLTRPWLVYHTAEGDRARVHVLDAASGEPIGEIPLDLTRPIENLSATFDGLLFVLTSQSIDCYGIETGSHNWNVSIAGQLQPASLRVTPDGVVYCDASRQLRKLALEDGRELWTSAAVSTDQSGTMRVEEAEGRLLALGAGSVTAVDAATGITLWRGTTPDDVRFDQHLLTTSHVVAVDSRCDPGPPTAYFYDLHTGRLPAPGGSLELEGVDSIDRALALDGALLIQSPAALHSFAAGK